MKKFRKLIPALAMLLVSAVLMSTASYAWFSMNTQVTATGMQVKAVAEDGIVISNSNKAEWSNTSSALVSSAALKPISTTTSATPSWVHAKSTAADEAQAAQDTGNYTDITLAWNTSVNQGIGYDDADAQGDMDEDEAKYVLLNNFYIKSSGSVIDGPLYINDVIITGATNKIDASLRILVVVAGTNNTDGAASGSYNAFTFAPVTVAGARPTTSYTFKGTATAVSAPTGINMINKQCDEVKKISNENANAVNVKIYMYFEGEDVNCKSTNISGIDTTNLALSVKFGLSEVTKESVTLTETLSNVTSNATGTTSICKGEAFTATYTAADGYVLPNTVSVTAGGAAVDSANIEWNSTTGVLTVKAAGVTGNLVVTVTGTSAP